MITRRSRRRGLTPVAPTSCSAGRPPSFLADLTSWLRDHRPQGPSRFLWVRDPTSPVAEWAVTEMNVVDEVVKTTVFQLAGYRLSVTGSNRIAPGELAEGGWGFVLGDRAEAPGLRLSTPQDLLAARVGSCLLSMAAGGTGGWRFVIDASAADGDAFTRLDAGVRYFVPGAHGDVKGVHFAALRQPAATDLAVYATVDPLRPLDVERTSIGFHAWTGVGTPPPLGSGYATVHGHGITLLPLAGAGLVFGSAPYFTGASTDAGHYLIPAGSFALGRSTSAAPGDSTDRVICGTSGLEYLGIPIDDGCTLTFVPGREAYVPLGSDVTADHALTHHGTTSWVSVESPATATVHYYSQPEDAPLFRSAAGKRAHLTPPPSCSTSSSSQRRCCRTPPRSRWRPSTAWRAVMSQMPSPSSSSPSPRVAGPRSSR